ncbi:UDP-glycosyltransferase 75C1-like [Bidens hawaiensis]|uniref:UDP-glycosyltransferase 75C1-like n=1 Tax=Bidens hawaiensis TaxID=980011 RepID=UPI00404A82A3
MTGHQKILIVTFAGQGLISPSLRFASRLLKAGVTSVTFSTSFSVIKCIDKHTVPHGLTFAPFSDGLDDHSIGKTPPTTLQQHISDFATRGAPAVAQIITSAAAEGEPFDHVVYTTIIPWVARVASAHNVESTLLWCQPAAVLDIYYHYFNGFQELISANKHNPLFPINLPGLPPLTLADLPSFFFPSSPKEHEFLVPIYKEHADVLKTGTRVLVNTTEELEAESIKANKNFKYLPIGPLNEKDSYVQPDNGNGYANWLNTQPKRSVVYVSFGSVSRLSSDQAEAIVAGLLESGRPFLWVIRNGDEAAQLSKISELKKQGLIVTWCCQVEVLSHEAIGCFLMHCGWNSTMEALAAGVPIVAYPQWTDQTTNAKMIEGVWKTGVRAKREGDGVVEGKEIMRCVTMVMGDEEIRRNASKWKKLASEAVGNGGSSTINLQAFLVDA